MSKPVFTKTIFIVTLDYNRYSFETIDQAARFVECITNSVRVSRDYDADRREDGAEVFYRDKITTYATIEAVNAVVNDHRTVIVAEPEEATA